MAAAGHPGPRPADDDDDDYDVRLDHHPPRGSVGPESGATRRP